MPNPTTPDNEDLFEAISHGIDNEGAIPDEPPENTTDDGVVPVVDAGDEGADGSGDETVDGEGADPDAVPAEDATDEEADAAGYARDPATGKFVKKDAEVKTPEQLAAEKVAADAAKAAKDPLNAPIPKELKQETQERMRTLVAMTKEVTQQRDQAVNDYNFLVTGIQATGTTPEQYGEVLSFMALLNSGDPKQQQAALDVLEDLGDRIAMMTGVERKIKDPLEAHQDLQAAVKAGQMQLQHAKEMARMRNGATFRQTLTTQQREQQTQTQTAEQATMNARRALDNLQARYAAIDPQWEGKRAQLVAALKPAFAVMDPKHWAAAFENAYKNMVYVPAGVRRQQRGPGNTPLRAGKGTGGGGGMQKQAGSALDAVSNALADLMGNR